jgi:4-hydroxybenzoate polyprenyltransferase
MFNYFPHITNIILTARVWKNLPLLFIFLSGMVIGSNQIIFEVAIISVLSIAFSSAFMTHLNIITDRKLDLIEKPHLYKMLAANVNVMKGALAVEFLVVLIGILLLIILKAYLTAGFILCFTLVTILYSYNFVSSRPEENRLKVFWHGHFFVLITGYLSLWYAGFFIGNTIENPTNWLLVFLSISLSEYALFLFESAVDQKAEKLTKLKTVASLLGKERSTYLSVGLSFVSLLLLFYSYKYCPNKQIFNLSFLPVSVFIFLFLAYISVKRLYTKQETYKVPDLIFNIGRLYILFTIIYIKYLQ